MAIWCLRLISSIAFHLQAEEPDRTKQQRMMFGNPYRQEKNDGGADEGWSEGTGGLLQRGRKRGRNRRIHQQGESGSSPSLSSSPSSSNLSSLADSSTETSSPNAEVTSPQRGQQSSVDAANTSTLDGKTVEPVSVTLERKDYDHRILVAGADNVEKGNMLRANHKSPVSIPEKLNEYGDKLRAVEKFDNDMDIEVANDMGNRAIDQGRRKRHMAPMGIHQEQSHVVAFLLSVIRALRYSKPSNTKQVIFSSSNNTTHQIFCDSFLLRCGLTHQFSFTLLPHSITDKCYIICYIIFNGFRMICSFTGCSSLITQCMCCTCSCSTFCLYQIFQWTKAIFWSNLFCRCVLQFLFYPRL